MTDNVQVAADVQPAAPVQDQVQESTPPDDLGDVDALFNADGVEQEHPAEPEVIDPKTYELPWEAGSSPLADEFRGFAAENKIPPEAVKAVAAWYKQAEEKAAVAEQEAKVQREKQALVELKNVYPDLQTKSKEVAAAAVRLGGKEFLDALKENGLITDKRVFNALLNARKVSSDFNADVVVTQAAGESVSSINERIAELMTNRAYAHPHSSEGKALHEEVLRLTEKRLSLKR